MRPRRQLRSAVRERAVLIQMICPGRVDDSSDDAPVIALSDADADAMLALTELTKPGPFRARTHTLGTFLGIRSRATADRDGRDPLPARRVPRSERRLHPPGIRGPGLARILVARIVNAIHAQGMTPFLHVDSENGRARSLYRRMGFVERAALPMVVVGRVD